MLYLELEYSIVALGDIFKMFAFFFMDIVYAIILL